MSPLKNFGISLKTNEFFIISLFDFDWTYLYLYHQLEVLL